jgi:ectoine hydroxylase-related dioxygenase (phytanoyl-CoA dioxygenase family)
VSVDLHEPRTGMDAEAAAAYQRDGVICLRGVLDSAAVERLREAVAWAMLNPSPLAQEFLPSEAGGRYFSDLHNFRRNAAYAALACDSDLPEIAGRAMGARSVRVLYDQTIVKEPGTQSPTPWHHDLPFWPVTGRQICSIWVALDEVTPESGGVQYARGSHLSGELYRPTQPDTPETRLMRNMDLPPAPNLSKDATADVVSWNMAPGDALVFSARTLHGAGANRASGRTRRAIVVRYVGEDVTFVEGPHALAFAEPVPLKTGDPLDAPQFPIVWRAA